MRIQLPSNLPVSFIFSEACFYCVWGLSFSNDCFSVPAGGVSAVKKKRKYPPLSWQKKEKKGTHAVLFIDDYAGRTEKLRLEWNTAAASADVCRLSRHLEAKLPASRPSRRDGEETRRTRRTRTGGVCWEGKHHGSLLHNHAGVCLIRKQAPLKLVLRVLADDLLSFVLQSSRRNLIKIRC